MGTVFIIPPFLSLFIIPPNVGLLLCSPASSLLLFSVAPFPKDWKVETLPGYGDSSLFGTKRMFPRMPHPLSYTPMNNLHICAPRIYVFFPFQTFSEPHLRDTSLTTGWDVDQLLDLDGIAGQRGSVGGGVGVRRKNP
jgi:hypothetical protein